MPWVGPMGQEQYQALSHHVNHTLCVRYALERLFAALVTPRTACSRSSNPWRKSDSSCVSALDPPPVPAADIAPAAGSMVGVASAMESAAQNAGALNTAIEAVLRWVAALHRAGKRDSYACCTGPTSSFAMAAKRAPTAYHAGLSRLKSTLGPDASRAFWTRWPYARGRWSVTPPPEPSSSKRGSAIQNGISNRAPEGKSASPPPAKWPRPGMARLKVIGTRCSDRFGKLVQGLISVAVVHVFSGGMIGVHKPGVQQQPHRCPSTIDSSFIS